MTNNKLKHLIYGSALRVTVRKGRKVWLSSETEHSADQDNASKLKKEKEKEKVEKFKNKSQVGYNFTLQPNTQMHYRSTQKHKTTKKWNMIYKHRKKQH